MTNRTVPPPASDLDSRSAGGPFSIVDELNCYFDSAAEPNNVHLEAWLPGRLSPRALRAATSAVLADVPAARARRSPRPWWQGTNAWEPLPAGDTDPVSVTGWRDHAELDQARARFFARAPDLDRSPPFRLLLAQGPEWDSVILNAHHAAFDGRSCLLLLSLIADRYREGQPPRSQPLRPASLPVPAGAARPAGHSGPDAAERPWPRSGDGAADSPAGRGARARRLALPAGRSARIAAQHTDARSGRGAPGYGFSLLEWPDVPAVPQPGSGPRITVNDLLIAALIRAIDQWNTPRSRRPAHIRITMPIDARTPGHEGRLGNHSRLCTIAMDPRLVADPAAAVGVVAAVAEQTRQAKAAQGPADSPALMLLARTRVPAPLKQGLIRLALRTVGAIKCDSSLLSNLGNVTDPPAFGTLAPTRMWFSTSAHMPRGLSAGAITVGGRLQVCFRYRTALMDDAAGRDFAAEYASALTGLTGTG